MNWNFGAPNLDAIKKLVTTEGTTLEEVLNNNTLIQSLRYETEEVIDFFSRRDIIKSLLIWSITTQNDEDPEYFKYSRLSTNVLTTPSIQLQNALIDSNLLISAFRNFFRLSPEDTPLICGNYQIIFEYFVKVTHGEILEQFSEITSYLIDRIQVLPLRLLLFDILTEFKEYLPDIQSVLVNISEIIEKGGPTAFGAVELLFDLFKNEKNPFKNESMEELVKSIFNYTILDTSTPLYKVQAYVVLELIIKLYLNTNFTDILKEYEDKVNFSSEKIDGIAVYRVYPKSHLSEAFSRFFKDVTNCTIGSICLSSIKSQDNLLEFVQKNNILNQIIELFDDEKCSGYLTEIALFLSEKIPGSDESNGDEKDIMYRWGKFVKNQIALKKKQIEESKKYGGDRPTMFGARAESKQSSGKSDISPITGIVTKTKISNEFNFDSDSDEDSSSDDEDNSSKTAQSHHLIRKDPVQDLHLSSSDEEKNSDGDDDGSKKETEQKTQEQEYSDMMMKLWGFSIAPVKKKEEESDDESYSYEEEDENKK